MKAKAYGGKESKKEEAMEAKMMKKPPAKMPMMKKAKRGR